MAAQRGSGADLQNVLDASLRGPLASRGASRRQRRGGKQWGLDAAPTTTATASSPSSSPTEGGGGIIAATTVMIRDVRTARWTSQVERIAASGAHAPQPAPPRQRHALFHTPALNRALAASTDIAAHHQQQQQDHRSTSAACGDPAALWAVLLQRGGAGRAAAPGEGARTGATTLKRRLVGNFGTAPRQLDAPCPRPQPQPPERSPAAAGPPVHSLRCSSDDARGVAGGSATPRSQVMQRHPATCPSDPFAAPSPRRSKAPAGEHCAAVAAAIAAFEAQQRAACGGNDVDDDDDDDADDKTTKRAVRRTQQVPSPPPPAAAAAAPRVRVGRPFRGHGVSLVGGDGDEVWGARARRTELVAAAAQTLVALFCACPIGEVVDFYRAFCERHRPVSSALQQLQQQQLNCWPSLGGSPQTTNDSSRNMRRLHSEGYFFSVQHAAGLKQQQFVALLLEFAAEAAAGGLALTPLRCERVFQLLASEVNVGSGVGVQRRLPFSDVIAHVVAARVPVSTRRHVDAFLALFDPAGVGKVPAGLFAPAFLAKFIDRHVAPAALEAWRLLLRVVEREACKGSLLRWLLSEFIAPPPTPMQQQQQQQIAAMMAQAHERHQKQHAQEEEDEEEQEAAVAGLAGLAGAPPYSPALLPRAESMAASDSCGTTAGLRKVESMSVAVPLTPATQLQLVAPSPQQQRGRELDDEGPSGALPSFPRHAVRRADAACIIYGCAPLLEIFAHNDLARFASAVSIDSAALALLLLRPATNS